MSLFLTGATGFLGSYLAAELLANSPDSLHLLVRSRSVEEAEHRLWRALQLHMDFETFWEHRKRRIEIHLGDICQPGLGLTANSRERLLDSVDSILHAAASLNRKSEEACANANVKGTFEVAQFARDLQSRRAIRRFSLVSTVAVSGRRNHESVAEDTAIRGNLPDIDCYGRSKKISEFLASRMLEGVPLTIFRPSAIIGDSRFSQTTQFDMVRAFAWLERFRILPLDPTWRIDIVPADFVSRAIVRIHRKEKPSHGIYHLSAGAGSVDYRGIADCLTRGKRKKIFAPSLCGLFMACCDRMAKSHLKWSAARAAVLVQVFRPHLLGDTVFDNTRIVQELGERPTAFTAYAPGLLRFACEHKFKYPHLSFPDQGLRKGVA